MLEPSHNAARPWSRGSYGLVVTLVAIAVLTALKLIFYDVIGAPTPFLLYFGAIIAAAWFDGYRGGLIVTGVSALLGNQLFMVSEHNGWLASLVRSGVFLLESVVITAITARLRSERTRAHQAADRAQRALAKLSAILEGVSDGITVQGPNGELIYANALAAELCGYGSVAELLAAPPGDAIGRLEVFDTNREPFAHERLPGRRVVAGESTEAQLLCFRAKHSGVERWVRVRANPVRIPGDARPYAINVLQDVTVARDQATALSVSEARFEATLRSIADAVIATDAGGRVTFMNERVELLSGVPLTAAEGQSFSEVFQLEPEADLGGASLPGDGPVERVLRSGQSVSASRCWLGMRDGRKVLVEGNAAPIRSEHGAPQGAVLSLRDASERVTDERRRRFLASALGELSSSLSYQETLPRVARLAVPELADGFVIDSVSASSSRRLAALHVDPRCQALLLSFSERYPQAKRRLGGVFHAAMSGNAVLLSRVTDEDLAAIAQDAEHLVLLRELRCASCIVAPLRVEGSVLGMLMFCTQLPAQAGVAPRHYEQKDLELAISLADRVALAIHHAGLYSAAMDARREAERASRAKDEFLAMLGHELRNPLAPIATALQLMKLRGPHVLERERAVLERQVKHLVTLVSDLLDVSRIARGKLELQHECVDLADALGSALELASPLIEQRRHALSVEVPRGLYVHGDPARLAQVLSNLLQNAAKYTEPGGQIRVRAQRAGERVRLCVQDSGAGISPELLPQVFDLFVQDKQALDRSQGGLGLGLAIVRNVVELHGGRVAARSAGPGQGSEFEVELPLLLRPSLAPSLPALAQARAASGAKVLVVDDNEDALCLLSEALALQGYQTHTASDPAEALVLAQELCPDVALLDIGLPVMDGYELARRLRAQRQDGDVLKLVAITGYGQPGDREQARRAGFDEHMVKPVRVEELQRVLTRLLERATV